MSAARKVTQIKPQPGPQTKFLGCEAEIVFYGGAAGGGKSFGLLIDPLRHHNNPDFGGVIFRRTSVQIKVEGGLWDQSMRLYSQLGARPRQHTLEWNFTTGMSMSFGYLEYDNDVYNYQSAEIPWMGFDELTQFSRFQFFYMLSRNRSTSGVKSRVRATMNPDPDSWVRGFIDWYIGEDGFVIPERSGVIRYFIQVNNEIIWGNTREELAAKYSPDDYPPTSFTFIAAKLQDNKILMESDSSYLRRLKSLNAVDRGRLLDGNWNIRAHAGTLFKEHWFPMVDAIPSGWTRAVRFWDRAATPVTPETPDPDWTRGLLVYKYPDNTFLVADLKSERDTPGSIERLIQNVASHDGIQVSIRAQQDPGSAGKSEAEHFVTMLMGYDVGTAPFFSDKVTRAKPASAQAEVHNIKVLRAPWNKEFFKELENFSELGTGHDDIVDTLSGAINELAGGVSIFSGGYL